MPHRMLTSRLPWITTLGLAAALLVGCTSTPDTYEGEGERRTIVADPLRDPEAAAQANREGLPHLDAGEINKAEDAFKHAIDQDKTLGPAHNHLGKVYYLRRRFYQAAHQFDRAIELMPNHAAPHNNLGLTLAEVGKLDDAIESFRKAITLDAYTIDYQANLARTLVQRGDETEELITLLRVIVERDERVNWRVWASQALARMGLK